MDTVFVVTRPINAPRRRRRSDSDVAPNIRIDASNRVPFAIVNEDCQTLRRP